MKLFIFIALYLSLFSLSTLADDGLLAWNGVLEVEAGLVEPGQTTSFSAVIENQNSVEAATSILHTLTNADYDFLGGVFPGIGGDCATSLAAGASCSVMIEFSPTNSGDNDDQLSLDYSLNTLSLGSMHITDLNIDGQSLNMDLGTCSALAPAVTSITPSVLNLSVTGTINLSGFNFSIATSVSVPGLVTSNLNVTDTQNLSFQLTSTAVATDYDLVVQNECGSITLANAITVEASTWIDLRTASGVAIANPVYTTAGINGYNIDTSYGFQIDNNVTGWNKFLRFDGACGPVGNDFDIVMYRTGASKSLLVSLWNQGTQVNPYPGTGSYARQYTGFWYSGGSSDSLWGSQSGEGGSAWNQNFTNPSLATGKFYRFRFNQAGQSGQNVEIWEVDANLTDIVQLTSFVSNKVASPATNVCPGLSTYTGGLSDYYVTAIRSL